MPEKYWSLQYMLPGTGERSDLLKVLAAVLVLKPGV